MSVVRWDDGIELVVVVFETGAGDWIGLGHCCGGSVGRCELNWGVWRPEERVEVRRANIICE